jgi:hypothetical protein
MDAVWNVAQYVTVQNDEVEVASFPDSKTATSWAVDLYALLETRQDRSASFQTNLPSCTAHLQLHSQFASFYILTCKIVFDLDFIYIYQTTASCIIKQLALC